MDYCDLTHTDRQLHKMRPRTPPMPPVSRRSRSRFVIVVTNPFVAIQLYIFSFPFNQFASRFREL